MVRMLLLGLVVVLSTLGGSYAAMKFPAAMSSGEKDPTSEPVTIVKLDPISVPVVRDGKIQGYVLGRLSFSAASSEASKNKDALLLYVNEAIFRAIYEEETLDFMSLRPIGVEALVGRVVEKANARIGRTAIVQVFVENLNFLAHEAVRCQAVKESSG
jgi:ribosomal protein L3